MDAFQRFHSLQDKDNVAMRKLNTMIKEFFQQGVAIVMLHHATKGGSFQGSTEIMSIADSSFIFEKIRRDTLEYSITPVKIRDVLEGYRPVAIAVIPAIVGGELRLDSVALADYLATDGEEGVLKAQPMYRQIVDVMMRCESAISLHKLLALMRLHHRRSGDAKTALLRLMDEGIVEEGESNKRGVTAYAVNAGVAERRYDDLDNLDNLPVSAYILDEEDEEDYEDEE